MPWIPWSPPDGYLTVAQVSLATGRTEAAIRRLVASGRLRAERVGGRCLVRREDALALPRGRRSASTADHLAPIVAAAGDLTAEQRAAILAALGRAEVTP